MPHFKKLTPNLLVANVERSLAFYVDTLGFERGMTVPDAVAVRVRVGDERRRSRSSSTTPRRRVKEYPGFAGKPIGATGTMFIEVEGRRRAARSAEADGDDRDAARDAVLRHARVRDRRIRTGT